MVARNEESLIKCFKGTPLTEGQQHAYVLSQISPTPTVSTAIQKIITLDQVEILINNSGGPKPGPITTALTNEFEQALVSTWFVTRY
ncbi:hypothetical protein CS542_00795 [Pedobacter sp. IW39]|nr:hypothetical protein CS542_00795 [Pedobacter sp. IW39]